MSTSSSTSMRTRIPFELSTKIFKHMGFGDLKEEYVAFGKKAKDGNDHIIFNAKDETVYYDPDGKGGKDQIAFMTGDFVPTMTTAHLSAFDLIPSL